MHVLDRSNSARFPALTLVVILLATGWLAGCGATAPTRPVPQAYAFVSNGGSHTVTVVDLATLETVATVPVDYGPSRIRAHPTRPEIYVVAAEADRVDVLDARTHQVAARIEVGERPYSLDFSPDGRRAYVANWDSNTVSAIDCARRQVVGTVRVGRRPAMARVTPDGALLVVSNRADSTVSLVATETLEVVATLAVARHPEALTILPDGSKVFVAATGSAQVSVVDLQRRVLLTNLAVVLIAADQLLLLGVDGDHRLARGLERQNLRVDMLELSVTVSMVAALIGLAVDLPAVAELMQQLAHRVGTNLVPHRPQRLGQLGLALGNPQQRAHRIATRDRHHQPAQILEQCRILGRQRPAPAAIAPNTSRGQRRPLEILQPTPDRTAR